MLCSRPSTAAAERYNLALFTPVGPARDLATALLRQAVETMIDGDVRAAVAILDQAVPESPDNSTAEISSCTGAALGLLDTFLGGPIRRRRPGSRDSLRHS